MNYIKENLLSILALLISLASFGLSFKNHLKSNVKLKISSYSDNNFCLGFIWYKEYRLIIINLNIENNSTSAVDISRIKLSYDGDIYIASTVDIKDKLNKDGISLISDDHSSYKAINIISENILNETRIDSYGTLSGFAVFHCNKLLKKPEKLILTVDTPSKSFSTEVLVNLCPEGYSPTHPLKY